MHLPECVVDEASFAVEVEGHRRELQVHCYRMVGSLQDAEDLVQETFLRAWRKRDTFQGRSTFRAWLYRIATNACLDFLERHPRVANGEVYWLQPFPDRMLETAAPTDAEPDAAVVAKETIELAFLVAIQHLPPKQRAVLIMRDVLGWPANDSADLLDLSVASVNSALQRARATLKEHLPSRRLEWGQSAEPTEAEKALLQRYMEAMERSDTEAMAELLHEDVRVTMPMLEACLPDGSRELSWFGRKSYLEGLAQVFTPGSPAYLGDWKSVPTRANLQPAVAHYVRPPGETAYRAQVLDVLSVAGGEIVAITAFGPGMFGYFGLPETA
jgi:RNA polymerase sigma-70 factor (ECF subfamily)